MSKFRANIFLIQTTSNYLWASEVEVVKVDYFDFLYKIFEKLVWIRSQGNGLQLLDFWIFLFFSQFSRSCSFVFEPKVEKNIHSSVFSTHFMPLISMFVPKIMEEWNNQLKKLWFLQATEDQKKFEVVAIQKILAQNLLIHGSNF